MDKPKIIAVIVAYNPEAYFKAYVEAVAKQTDHVIIVDNSTSVTSINQIDGVAGHFSSVTIVRPGGNIGLAAAQNLGIRQACDVGADWVLIMDDDSLIPDHIVAKMLAARAAYSDPERVGILAPCVADKNSGRIGTILISKSPWHVDRLSPESTSDNCDLALSVIASGSLISVPMLEELGSFKESYFIDSIDVEYSLRARRAGWKILVIRDALLSHELGQKTVHRFFGLNFITSNHAVWRRYTMYRNRVDIWKHYVTNFPAYIGYDMLVAVFELIKIVLFEENAWAKVVAAARGVRHGVLGYFDNDRLFKK